MLIFKVILPLKGGRAGGGPTPNIRRDIIIGWKSDESDESDGGDGVDVLQCPRSLLKLPTNLG